MSSLELGIIGNCAISALIDRLGTVVWSCFPRFDGDPLFCRLLDDGGERSGKCGAHIRYMGDEYGVRPPRPLPDLLLQPRRLRRLHALHALRTFTQLGDRALPRP